MGWLNLFLIVAATKKLKYVIISILQRIQPSLLTASTTYFKKGISPLHPVSIPVFPPPDFSKVTFVVARKHL